MSTTPASPTPAIAVNTSLDVAALINAIHDIQAQSSAQRNLDRYAELVCQLCKVSRCAVIQSDVPASGPPTVLGRSFADDGWLPLARWFEIGGIGQRAVINSFAHEPMRGANGLELQVVLIRLKGAGNGMLYLELPSHDRTRLNEAVLRGMLVADLSESTHAAHPQTLDLLTTLDYSAEIMRMDDFTAAALSLANGAVAKLSLEFAALCWVQHDQCEVKAISHLNQFDRDTDQVRYIEEAAFEALEFNQELIWPAPQHSFYENQLDAIQKMAQEQGFVSVAAVPMRDPLGDISAVLVVATKTGPIPLASINQLQIALDLVQPRMQELYTKQLSRVARAKLRVREKLTQLLGPDLVLTKAAAIFAFIVILLSNIIPWSYRIDAAAELVTDSTRALSAQFDGRIDQVFASTGDVVEAGRILAILDTRELAQQQIELTSDLAKSEAELRKARAENALAEVEIYQAKYDETNAKLARTLQAIAQATTTAPFQGVIVEGERRDLLGAPLKRGDKIFRIAKTENLYLSLLVSEKEIRDVHVGSVGVFSLLSRPDQEIEFTVVSIIPMAQVRGQDGNHFQVKAKINRSPEAWWRPGMTGLAKIDAGSRRIFWLLTHKIVDFLRMKLWF
jgi:multidrug resistance efflux pump